MSVTIHCPHCGATGNAPDHILGQSVRCSKCKKQFLAGGEEEEEVPEEPADDYDDMDDAPPPRRGGARSRPSRGGGGGGGEGGSFGDVLVFRKLVAPTLILILYWIANVGLVLMGFGTILMSFFSGNAMIILSALFGGLIGIVVGLVLIRVSAELMMVQFRIYERLKEIKGGPSA